MTSQPYRILSLMDTEGIMAIIAMGPFSMMLA